MRQFFQDYWWALCGAFLAAIFAIINLRHARTRLIGTLSPVSFAAVRAFSVGELRPFFGVYRPTWREFLGYGVLVIWLGGMSSLIAYTEEASSRVVILAGLLAAAAAGCAAVTDGLSSRVLGPDRISFESPVAFLSWSIPLGDVQQCDLVPGRPYNRLRVVSRQGARSLPLPLHLWRR